MSRQTANVVVLGVAGLSLALLWLTPGALAGFLGLIGVALTAYLRPAMAVRAGSLALLALGFTLALSQVPRVSILFYGLVAVLVALITIPGIPRWIKGLLGVAVLLISVPIAGFNNTFFLELGIQIGIYAAMALGLNVVVGMAGLLDLGYAAFFAIGAYTWAIFGSPQAANFLSGSFPLPGNYFYLFMALAIITTAITGLLIGLPALRLRGDYLAIVTLGLGEVVRVLANNLDHPVNFTNGPQGITPVSRPDIGWFHSLMSSVGVELDARTDYQFFFYLLVLVIIGVVVLVNINLGNSRFGRAWIAIREDETAAKAMGIPMLGTKLLAFATGAAFSGAMGVIFAAQRTFVSPESFTLLASITILGMVVLGGMGSIPGVILGAAALTAINTDVLKSFSEYLNNLRQAGVLNLPNQVEPAKYERLVFGVILVLMMIFRPQGLIPERRHQLEIEEAKEAQQ
ncbi:branched-chain amino acid ABC transporter permease [Calidithermus chliarophilus]|uniref:branched-chain amino acid ABC transporter permease n=1 Tax=Calidithermus chliarophilus TaxID=52023 RepID=UPI00040B61F6|nr:branched-chain amino acid ABC transporter permease [Calidithermus chliarophilus]